jgi:hypothetical protein
MQRPLSTRGYPFLLSLPFRPVFSPAATAAAAAAPGLVTVQARVPGVLYSVDHYRSDRHSVLVIMTNAGGATNFKVRNTCSAQAHSKLGLTRIAHSSPRVFPSCTRSALLRSRRLAQSTGAPSSHRQPRNS